MDFKKNEHLKAMKMMTKEQLKEFQGTVWVTLDDLVMQRKEHVCKIGIKGIHEIDEQIDVLRTVLYDCIIESCNRY